jgi:hypothetical protein
MSANTWVESILRIARGRADRLWHAGSGCGRGTPDYDIPAFIRRGIRIPALETFHGNESQPATTDRRSSGKPHPHREEF